MATEWETPHRFFETLDREFNFDVDTCAIPSNAKCSLYYTPEQDGLTQKWKGVCWCNPPYDRSIGLWIKKAYETSQHGNTVVCLIQGRSTDTIWWHNYVMRSSEIRFIKDRLYFGLNNIFSRANISSIVVIFRPYCQGPPKVTAINNEGSEITRD